MAAHTLSPNLVAVDATKYQLLRAAAKDSMSHWYQAQEYKRQLLASQKESRVLFVLLSLTVLGSFILAVTR